MTNGENKEPKIKKEPKKTSKTLNIALIALFSAIIAICSFISIPFVIPFSMQSFGVLFALAFLGAKKGTLSFLIYLTLGITGLPIFAGANGGISIIAGPTGGYLVGWAVAGILAIFIEKVIKKERIATLLSLSLGLIICYMFGTAWYIIYMGGLGEIGLWSAICICVLPFITFDIIKLILAERISTIVKRAVNKKNI